MAELLVGDAPARRPRRAPPRGHPVGASKWRGVRLLWEESGLEAVGAFCVAAFALLASWTALEGILGLPALVAAPAAIAVTAWALETTSRRHYGGRARAPVAGPLRSASTGRERGASSAGVASPRQPVAETDADRDVAARERRAPPSRRAA